MDFSCPAPFRELPLPKIDMNEGKTAEVAEPDCRGMLIVREIEIDLRLLGEKADVLLSRASGLTGEYF